MNKLGTIVIIGLILIYSSAGWAAVVGYWSFDNSGNPGYDDSGNGNNGTVHGATWVTPAKPRRAGCSSDCRPYNLV